MSLLSNAKILGGIGALLTLFSFLPSFGPIIGIVGFILIIIAVKYISDEIKDKSIMNNFLYFFILVIVAFIIAAIIIGVTFIEVGGISYFIELQNLAYTDPMEILEYLRPVIPGAVAAFVSLWIFMLLSAVFLKKCYDKIGEHTNVKWFQTTGLLYLIGAATLIIIVGFIIIFIGIILEIVAFFSLPDKLPEKKSK